MYIYIYGRDALINNDGGADANLYTFMTANTIKCPKTSILKCADIQ